jgi:hypothetical protein
MTIFTVKAILVATAVTLISSSYASSAPKCGDDTVKNDFLTQYTCNGPLSIDCEKLAVQDYGSLKHLNDQDIEKRLTTNWPKRSIRETAMGRALDDRLLYKLIEAAVGMRDMVREVNLVDLGYNPTSQRYECQANLTLDKRSIERLSLASGYRFALDHASPNSASADIDYSVHRLNAAAKSYAQTYARCAQRHVTFSLQAAPLSGFVVQIDYSRCGP